MGYRYNPLQYAGLIPTTNGGGGGTTFTNNVEYVTLTNTDITNKSITLSNAPLNASHVLLTVIDGVPQQYGVDYTVTGTTLSWNGLGLEPLLEVDMVLLINYIS